VVAAADCNRQTVPSPEIHRCDHVSNFGALRLVNLLRNSIEALSDAGRHDGRIVVTADQKGHCMLRVKRMDTPVILITGHGDIAMAVTAMREGANDFVEKPYDAEQLIASIERALTANQRVRLLESERQLLSQRVGAIA
jgi:DNA-binding NtrC family response regulator